MNTIDGLRNNVSPRQTPLGGPPQHWVQYDINYNGQPIKRSGDAAAGTKAGDPDIEDILSAWGDEDEVTVFGHMEKGFKTEFEARVWLAGNDLQGRYLGHCTLYEVRNGRRW